jgi:hypothetical protein
MLTFLYRCPNIGLRVQGFAPDETSDDDTFAPLTCTACERVHMVNPKTEKVLGRDKDE